MRGQLPAALLGLCAFCQGCGPLADTVRTVIGEPVAYPRRLEACVDCKRAEKLAAAAWGDFLCAHPDWPYSRDYGQGFKDGYVDYLLFGGAGNPPPLPPRWYWRAENKTPEGRLAEQDWSMGFRFGAAAARQSGYREIETVGTWTALRQTPDEPDAGAGFSAPANPASCRRPRPWPRPRIRRPNSAPRRGRRPPRRRRRIGPNRDHGLRRPRRPWDALARWAGRHRVPGKHSRFGRQRGRRRIAPAGKSRLLKRKKVMPPFPKRTPQAPAGGWQVRRAFWRWVVILLVGALNGCAAISNPVANGIPVRRVPPELLGESRENMQTMPLTLLRQPPPKAYRLDAGDVLGVWVEGVLGEKDQPPPVRFSELGNVPPALGLPIPVRDDGTIALPYLPPMKVGGMTLEEAQEAVRRAYIVDRQILKPGEERILVTLQQRRQYHILVIREDAASGETTGGVGAGPGHGVGFSLSFGGGGPGTRRGAGYSLDLPAYENDVLNALSRTGGFPGTDAVNEVLIYRGSLSGEKDRADLLGALPACPSGAGLPLGGPARGSSAFPSACGQGRRPSSRRKTWCSRPGTSCASRPARRTCITSAACCRPASTRCRATPTWTSWRPSPGSEGRSTPGSSTR